MATKGAIVGTQTRVGNTNCRPNTEALSAFADQPWVKALRRKVAYHLSCLPLTQTVLP
ncbi:MAG: hypothetical protein LBC02_10310 [Planctomycetaceae bacterium]|nr:hypothetical protein [Planctomycetaceae bacterium]